MSGEFEIRGGGAIAVDTETLRATAARFVGTGIELGELRQRLGALQNMLFVERDVAWGAVSAASVLSTKLATAIDDATRIADDLREAATVYELVDLNARHVAAILSGDADEAGRIAALTADVVRAHPEAMAAARGLEFERTIMWPSDLVRAATEAGMDAGGLFDFLEFAGPSGRMLADAGGVVGGVVGGLSTIAAATLVGAGGWGRIPNDARLSPARDAVAVRALTTSGTTTAPTGLAAAVSRMPSGEARVRVERYVLPGGATQYAVYVAGTRSGGRDEAWDTDSNVDLALGRESASYRATLDALDAAGAQPGDVVHAFGHSQGAMITSHLALDGRYDVQTLVSFGSPVEADVGDGTLAVSLRHTDDPVAALSGGGHSAGVGAQGSVIVERSTHDPAGAGDGPGPHSLARYAETAAMADRAGDPRIDHVRAVLGELGTATSVEVSEYTAERRAPVSSTTSAGGAGGSRRPS